jgi:hypothetical protein
MGNTGMKAKALIQSNSSWFSVTQSERAEAAQLSRIYITYTTWYALGTMAGMRAPFFDFLPICEY